MKSCCLSKTSISKKMVMAVSGFMLMAFAFGHMLGNLQIFLGREVLNAYALKLQHLGEFLWVVRLVLLLALISHIVAAVRLTIENRAARPVPNVKRIYIKSTYAARTMMMSGVIIASFIVYHLLHLTFRVTHPEMAHMLDSRGNHDVYGMVVSSFKQWPLAFGYVVSVAFLANHLSHGFASAFQSLGLNSEKLESKLQCLAKLIGVIVFVGYSSIPLSILIGIVK